jgi:aconitate decarboxylase
MSRVPDVTATEAAADDVTDPRGVTGALSRYLAAASLDDIPERVAARAEHLVLDGIGCGLLAAHLPWSQRAVEAAVELEGEGAATLWGWDRRMPAPAAALLNGTFIQGFELDDYHQFGPLHSEACVVPSVLATAEQLGKASGRDFLAAAAYGFETGPRIGMAMGGLALVARGWHCGSVYGTIASAAGAGKLRGLTAAQFEDAIGIAATQSSGLMAAQYEAMVKRMHSGIAARSGLYAAALAANGFTGIKRVIEREYGGFASTFSPHDAVDLDRVMHEFGERWEIERICVKPYSCMGGLHSTVDGALALRQRGGFTGAEVRSVHIGVAHAMYHHAGWQLERPAQIIGAQMNLAYAAAVTLLDGTAFVPQFDPDRLAQDDVWELIGRTTVEWDQDIDDLGEDARWTSRLRIQLVDGSTQEIEVRHPLGGLERPMTNDELRQKFRRMASLVIDDRARIAEIERFTLSLREQEDALGLSELLAPRVHSPFGP